MVRTMPPVWDETHVLPGSRIGELAALARRSGKEWYVGVINGGGARTYTIDFSFLGKGSHQADFFADFQEDTMKFDIKRSVTVTRKTTQMIHLNPGGGFTARIR
jgi:alpha-glucosidase